MDQLRFEALVDLAAQPAYVGFDDVRMGVEMNIPDVLEEHCARHHLPCMPHQVFKQSEFAGLPVLSFRVPRRLTDAALARCPAVSNGYGKVRARVRICHLSRHDAGKIRTNYS
jgi:hypothetical protein